MLSLGQTLASAAGLRPKKKFHFEVTFNLQDLLNCTYVSGVLFAKIRLKEGGHFSHASRQWANYIHVWINVCPIVTTSMPCVSIGTFPSSVEVKSHTVTWEEEVKFSCKLYASANTAELEPCICKVSVRKVSTSEFGFELLQITPNPSEITL